jgi:hypothetical protein
MFMVLFLAVPGWQEENVFKGLKMWRSAIRNGFVIVPRFLMLEEKDSGFKSDLGGAGRDTDLKGGKD